MIVLINGSFGVGKTSAAEALEKSIPNTLLFDPEEVGAMLRSILGDLEWTGDFQDYPMWRSLVIDTARELHTHLKRDLIVPMTLWRTDYFQEIENGLRSIDSDFHQVCLIASEDEIHRRIRERGEQPEGDWVYDQVPKCIEAFKQPMFEKKIDVTSLSKAQVVDGIRTIIGR